MFENDATTGIKFNILVSLKILKLLGNGINFDFTVLENLIVNSAQDTQTAIAGLTTEIEEIKTLVQGQQSATGLSFTPLTLNPTYQSNSSHGWASGMEPQNLQAIYDSDESSASNLFGIRFDVAWSWGEIIATPGIVIPGFTRINLKLGIRNSGNSISLYELAAFNVTAFSYVNIWNYYGAASSTQDLIVNIDIVVPYVWDKLKLRLTHARDFAPQARIYDLKVWEVS